MNSEDNTKIINKIKDTDFMHRTLSLGVWCDSQE